MFKSDGTEIVLGMSLGWSDGTSLGTLLGILLSFNVFGSLLSNGAAVGLRASLSVSSVIVALGVAVIIVVMPSDGRSELDLLPSTGAILAVGDSILALGINVPSGVLTGDLLACGNGSVVAALAVDVVGLLLVAEPDGDKMLGGSIGMLSLVGMMLVRIGDSTGSSVGTSSGTNVTGEGEISGKGVGLLFENSF